MGARKNAQYRAPECSWGTLATQRGWKRGYAHARLISRFPLELTIASQGWTGSTRGGEAEADIVQVDSNHLYEEASKSSSKWAGKVLLIAPRDASHQDFYGTQAQLPTFLATAKDSGAIAIIERDSRPGVLLAHTGPGSVSARAVPMAYASLAREQADLITRLLDAGTTVRVRIDIRNEFTPGEVSSSNIVGRALCTQMRSSFSAATSIPGTKGRVR